jgi:predicted RNA-binding Zn-ribbon protein involved in translation (DUF1610 family)
MQNINNFQVECPSPVTVLDGICDRTIEHTQPGSFIMKPKKCVICNSEFNPRTSLQKYCSPKCSYEARLEKDRKHLNNKKCPVCNEEFKPYHSLQKFCSYECQVEYKKSNRKGNRRYSDKKIKNISGKNNPAYRNGSRISGKDSRKKERQFKKNSKAIKDQMINELGCLYCENCETNQSLRFEAHHIIYRSEKPNHPLLHHKKNILILCIRCHNDWHKSKGLRNTIVKQRKLHEYFGNDVLNK